MADLLVDTDVFVDHLRGAHELRPTGHRLHYSAPFRELDVTRAIAERAGRIAREFGTRLPDALIAATALEHGLALVTRSRKDFVPIRGVRVRALR